MFSVVSYNRTARYVASATLLVAVALSAGAPASVAQRQAGFASPAFERVWQRTDLPVARGDVVRTWFWGPQAGRSLEEPSSASPGGKRLVQYFDKARMEINDPAANPNSPWFVTNGLLTVELISGQLLDAGADSSPQGPADIPLASDLDDANAPTYRSFRAVADVPGNNDHQVGAAVGKAATATIDREGRVGSDPGNAAYGEAVRYAHYEPATRHNIPAAFWDFLNSVDIIYEGGQTKLRLLSDPWFYATGYPISEAYWARVKIAGQANDVMVQAFQRRVLTYVPANPAGWRVQMGNIGQHYYQWRYGAQDPAPTPGSTAQPTGRIAFVSDRAGGLGIFTMAADGSGVRQVAKTPGGNYAPKFAPGGHGIVYHNASGQSGSSGINASSLDPTSRIYFTSDSQGSDGTPMGATSVRQWEGQADPAYAPNGYLLAFRGKPAGEAAGLFVANLASDAPFIPVSRLTTGAWDRQPAWHPDGTQIAFTSGSSADDSQIWVVNSDGTGKRRLTDAVPRQRDLDPAWSPDGKSIVYVTNRNTGRYDIALVAKDGTLGPSLTSGELVNHRNPAYSPDGKWLVFGSDREGNLEIVLAPADISRWSNLTRAATLEAQPSWGR